MNSIKKLFSFEGRIGRWQFWKYVLLALVFNLLAIVPMMMHDFFVYLYLATLPFQLWIGLAYPAQRLRDAGYSPWLTLGILIPFVDFAIVIMCGFFKTKPEAA